MTTVYDCMQEIIAKGPTYFIRSSVEAGARTAIDWDPVTLMEDMRQTSPAVLEDHAWTEWSVRPAMGSSCFIHYGIRGSSLGHLGVPVYGHLRALEQSHRRQAGADTTDGGTHIAVSSMLGYW